MRPTSRRRSFRSPVARQRSRSRAERLESKFASGEASDRDLDLYQRASGNLRRLLESVGLQRRQRDVTPSLDQYIAARYGQPDDVIEGEVIEADEDAEAA